MICLNEWLLALGGAFVICIIFVTLLIVFGKKDKIILIFDEAQMVFSKKEDK